MKLSKPAIKRLILLVLAIACLVPAMPVAAGTERPTRAQALAALKKSDPDERRRRALAVNPNLEGVRSVVEELEPLIARRRQRSI